MIYLCCNIITIFHCLVCFANYAHGLRFLCFDNYTAIVLSIFFRITSLALTKSLFTDQCEHPWWIWVRGFTKNWYHNHGKTMHKKPSVHYIKSTLADNITLKYSIQCYFKDLWNQMATPVSSFTKEVNPRLAKRPFEINGCLANLNQRP